MGSLDSDKAFLREFQKRFEKKVQENEISTIQYWKERLDKLIAMKPEGISSLQLEMKKLSTMMKNRIESLKKE
jgi:hypothetical protein